MNQCSKRRSDNREAVTQRWSVITLQEIWNSSENSEKKRDERDTKEIDWLNLSRNCKHINNATKFNNVALQTWKQKHCTLCDELESSSSFRKISDMSEENCKLNARSV